eukprot:CAMPEP_0115296138 /NCGR_PEP_ID=MMETSP0270-20121206/67076_1 /TAXON_ID=71861 /ORGANISM="Scrippsiella trochoidea, Strain CCMP3099" /LENGTH=960 /DNA_ID=CAMNT_0002713751 /DNA_START=9 /DNA_END=2891 /DNA_ORIENTATION=+
MQPFGGYPGQPGQSAMMQPPPPAGGQPMSNPFGAAPGAGATVGGVRSSPFGAPGAGGGMGGPPAGGMGGPPMGGMGAPPSAPFGAGSVGGPPPGPGGMGPPPTAARGAVDSYGAPPSMGTPYPGSGVTAPAEAPPGPFNHMGGPAASPGPSFYPAGGTGVPSGVPGVPSQAPGQDQQAILRDMEMCNSPPHFMRSTMSRLPNAVSTKQKCNIPLGIVLQPLAPLPPGVEEVPSVNHGAVGSIVRCSKCRTYVNPFVQWEANGRRWTCNLCGHSQATADTYVNNLDETGRRVDRFQRPELCNGAVEYIAPGEYMVRPPQPPVFMFVIDVSYTAVVTGMLDTVVSSIKETIQSGQIPGGQRVQMGIITFDSSLHFYNLNSNLSQPQMLVVSDLEDLFLPLPDDILVPISESQSAIMNLLDSLPSMFRETQINESCMGSAVKGAFMAMKHIGGKLLVFGANIPSIGDLSLKSTRDNPRLLGTDREVELLRPVNDGYKDLGAELTRAQISVEMFLAPQQYIDLASISPLAKYTGGDIRYYPNFHIQHSGMKLKTELMHVLTRYMGWEAVMRVRVSRGWKITKFYGHLFIRGQDLLVVPNCHSDQTFAIAIDMEENVTPDPILCVQSALLYTNCEGERRIRVHTWAGLTTQDSNAIINSVDVQATAAMLSQIALEQSLKTTLSEGRNRLQTQCQQIVQAGNLSPNTEALQFLPLYIMGMLKSQAFRATNDISADLRTHIWMRLETLTVSQLAAYFYPRMMALHNLADNIGVPDEHGRVALPDMLNLTSESMTQDGVYLLEDGDTMLMWIGRAVDTNILQALFGVPSFEQLDPLAAEGEIGTRSDPLSSKIAAILRQVREERPVPQMQLKIIRCGDQIEPRFFASLIEDRTIGLQSTYTEFLQRMGYRPQQQSQAAPPGAQPNAGAPPGGAPASGMPGAAPGGMPGGPPMGNQPPMGAMAPPSIRR